MKQLLLEMLGRHRDGDPVIDGLIRPPRQIFAGFDPDLQERTDKEREKLRRLRAILAAK